MDLKGVVEKVKIAILDDQGLIREGLKQILSISTGCSLIETYNGDEIEKVKKNLPDVLILDLAVRIANVFDFIDYCTRRNTSVVVMTNELEPNIILKAIRRGISGYLLKKMSTEELIKSLNIIFKGGTFFHHHISDVLLKDYLELSGVETRCNVFDIALNKAQRPNGLLTSREWEVLNLLVKGFNNTDLGEALNISPRTVKVHVSSLLKKLKVSDRTSAVILAVSKGWATLPKDEEIEILIND